VSELVEVVEVLEQLALGRLPTRLAVEVALMPNLLLRILLD
jgi:hypothetical protein